MNTRHITGMLAAVAALILAGCAASSTVTYQTRPRWRGEVAVYDVMPPEAEKVAELLGEGGLIAGYESIISTMKKKAAGLGANGLVVTRRDSDLARGAFTAAGTNQVTGTAIWLPDP